MQKKRVRTNFILNKLHHGAVYSCIAVTLGGCVIMGMKAYNYYTVVKPERKKAQLQLIKEDSLDKAKELKC